MANLTKRVFRPSVSYEDKIMFMNSHELNQALSTDNPAIAVGLETMIQMLNSQSTRYMGLQFLEQALRQNPEKFFCNGRWTSIIFNILKDAHAENLEKMLVCKILALTIPCNMDNEHFLRLKEEVVEDIYPFLLERIKENVEWTEEACKLVKTCLKSFPSHLNFYQSSLLKVILHQATISVSSKSFEVLAECFCELPYCTRDNNANAIKACWSELYKRTLMTLDRLRMECLSYATQDEEPCQSLELDCCNEFNFEDEDATDYYVSFMNNFRRFVNLSKCLAKLLSVKSRYSVKVPVLATIRCFVPLYVLKKEKGDDALQELIYTFLVPMQLAGVSVVEAIVLNSKNLKHIVTLKDFMLIGLRSSNSQFSSEPVSELRAAVWKLMHLWLESVGKNASQAIVPNDEIMQALLTDILLETYESLQSNSSVQTHKSKKSAANSRSKSIVVRSSRLSICEAALRTLESLIYCGSLDFKRNDFEELCFKIFHICHAIYTDPIPFPYHNESCRRKLYSIVVAISSVMQPGEDKIIRTAMAILSRTRNDPSFKVRKLSNKASVIFRLQIYPKRQIPVSLDNNQKKSTVSEERLQYGEWASDSYVQSIKVESEPETSENVITNVEHSFQNQSEVEIHSSEEYMDMEPGYSEQVVGNQCNGEDLEIPSSSQCQEEEESDEEEEEEEDDHSYGEEGMNQDDELQPEQLYIPETAKAQNSNSSLQIKSESIKSISEPEYEELTHNKIEENTLNSSSKDRCVNGDDTVVHESVAASLVQQTAASNENGIFGVDDDDDEDDDDDDDEGDNNDNDVEERNEEEDDEESSSPCKKQKIQPKDDLEVVDTPRSPSPTLDMMMDDVNAILPSEEDIKSGKASLCGKVSMS